MEIGTMKAGDRVRLNGLDDPVYGIVKERHSGWTHEWVDEELREFISDTAPDDDMVVVAWHYESGRVGHVWEYPDDLLPA